MSTVSTPRISRRNSGDPTVLDRWAEVADRVRRRLVGSDGVSSEAHRSPTQAYALSLLVVLLYRVHQFLTRGSYLRDSIMWAEMGANYYPNSVNGSLAHKLLATDAGYIPLPQRIIALVCADLGVPASSIPSFYTGAAVLGTGLLVATMVLPGFRRVISSDWLRFALAIGILLVLDFETRTFINFTYLAVVPAAMLTALALVQRTEQVPAWAWALPVFMVSKPAVLASLPMMVVAALVSTRRFRAVTVVSVGFGLVQVARMVVSTLRGGSLLQQSDSSIFEKLWVGIRYAGGFLARFLLGPEKMTGAGSLLALVLGALLIAAILRGSGGPGVGLVLVGVSLVLFSMLLNAVSFAGVFSPDLVMLKYSASDRRFLLAVVGTFLIVGGSIALLTETWWRRRRRSRVLASAGMERAYLGVALFCVWFAWTGWLAFSILVNGPLTGPPIGNSQWLNQSAALDSPGVPACVPLDPLGWFYGRDCAMIDSGLPADWTLVPVAALESAAGVDGAQPRGSNAASEVSVTVAAPITIDRSEVISVAVIVAPESGDVLVRARAVLTSTDGSTVTLFGSDEVTAGGHLLQFDTKPASFVSDVDAVTFVFDTPVRVGSTASGGTMRPVVLWMGRAR